MENGNSAIQCMGDGDLAIPCMGNGDLAIPCMGNVGLGYLVYGKGVNGGTQTRDNTW